MHVVKPNGHQTAFWMMHEGDGMKNLTPADGTANDGAEIDIVEATKTIFSLITLIRKEPNHVILIVK